jgi:hypothetical protein
MGPEFLHALSGAKGLPLPTENVPTSNEFAEAFRKEQIYRVAARRGGDEAIRQAESRPVWRTAKGKQTQSRTNSAWTHAECAQACIGMDAAYFNALRFSYAADLSKYWPLRARLFEWALERREIEGWDEKVPTVYGHNRFLMPLVEVFMHDEIHGGSGRIPIRIDFPEFAFYDSTPGAIIRANVGLTSSTWKRRVSPIYEAIRQEYLVWLAIGEALMKPWLREEVA